MNKILKIIGSIYVALMLAAYPIIMTDKYYNITDTKLYFFYIVTACSFAALFLVVYLGWLKNQKLGVTFSKRDFGLVVPVVLLVVLGVLNSDSLDTALRGDNEYGLGLIYLIILILGISTIKITGFFEEALLYAGLTGDVIVGSLALLQFLGVDLFGLIRSIRVEDSNLFISTIGNTSFFGAYVVIIFSLAAYAFCYANNIATNISIIGIIMSVFGVIVSNTDATILALVVEILLLGLLVKDGKDYFRLISIVGISVLIFNLLLVLSPDERVLGGVQRLFISPALWVVVLLLSGLYFVLGEKIDSALSARIIRVVCLLGLGALLISPIIAIVYSKNFYINMESTISRLFYLDDNWGNKRGYIWRKTLEIYNNGSLSEKLFGRGVGSLSTLLQAEYNKETLDLYKTLFDDAHNMYLQVLVEYGVLGLLSAASFCLIVIRRLFTSGLNLDRYRGVAFIGLMVCSTCLIMQNITPAFIVLFI